MLLAAPDLALILGPTITTQRGVILVSQQGTKTTASVTMALDLAVTIVVREKDKAATKGRSRFLGIVDAFQQAQKRLLKRVPVKVAHQVRQTMKILLRGSDNVFKEVSARGAQECARQLMVPQC